MKKLSFNAINSVMGKELTPTQRMMRSKVKLFKPASIHVKAKPGNNDPCPCGSKLKYKYCCRTTKSWKS